MHILKARATSAVLRIGIIFCLATLFLALAAVGILQGTFLTMDIVSVGAQAGVLDLRGHTTQDRPISLDGIWEYYPKVFQIGDQFDSRILDGSAVTLVEMPLNRVSEATGPGTYRLRIETDVPLSDYSFYLENYNEDFAIYVNGQRVYSIWGGPQEKLLYTLSDYLFRIDAPVEPGVVEVVISANSSQNQGLLYRNSILFGQADDVVDYVAQVWRDDTFLIGMILVMVTFGLVFMLIRTKYDMLTGITLFDTFLAIRILLGYSVATYFIQRIVPNLSLGNVDFVGLQYSTLFLTGTFGCLLSQSIFDPKRVLSIWPIRAQIVICSVGAFFTIFFFQRFSAICIGMLFLVLVFSFLIVTWHVGHLIREKRLSLYYLFQIVKTYYVGGVMALDILYLRGTSYNALIYAYVVFLLAHLVARLMDSNASYKEVEILNRNLEQMIDARTSQLTESNRSLSELSVRDPLTQAHNRLFFEEDIEKTLRSGDDVGIFLCMFDLDHFKSINDRFGHAAGDEQLKFVVNIVCEILGKRGTLSRIGGEEFVILFRGQTRESVLSLLEQIRRRLEEDARSNQKRTTASFGVVKCRKGDTSKSLLRLVDKHLYSAKKLGRNCIVVGQQTGDDEKKVQT